MDFFSVQNILVHIPIGAGGYDLSWIEAVGTIAGLLCIGPVSYTHLCQAAVAAAKLAKIPKPPSQAVYEVFKNAPLDFKP